MRNTILAGALAALTVASAGVALAQQAPVQPRAPHAMRADADGDGRISQAEFVGRRVQRLGAADANRDGSVAPEEMRAGPRGGPHPQRVARMHQGAARMHRGGDRMAHRGQRMEGRGPISIAEVQGKAEQAFTRLDADHDGFVTVAERQAGMQASREQRRAHMTERRAARQAQRQASPPAPASE